MCETPTPGNAPKYLKNSATRADGTVDEYAYTRVDGRRISLGRYGDPEGYQRWKRLLNEWLAAHDLDQAIEPSRVTVADLADRWLDSERSRMDSARISRKTYAAACYAAEAAVLEHAGSLATTFGPKALKSVQARLVRTPCKTIRGRYRNAQKPPTLSRTEVNRRVNGIRQMFRWGVSEELVPPATLASLRSVSGLRAGEGRDNPARKPADPAAVRALAAELRARGHHGHASVLEILRWTGCRPEEVCSLTAADVRQASTGLELHIRNHKTRKSTNADRIIPLNDRAESLVNDAIAERSAIEIAAQHGHTRSVTMLIDAYASANRSRAGLLPIHYAASNSRLHEHPELIEILTRAGWDINERSRSLGGKTPLDIALFPFYGEADPRNAETLRAAGGKRGKDLP